MFPTQLKGWWLIWSNFSEDLNRIKANENQWHLKNIPKLPILSKKKTLSMTEKR